MNNSHGSTVVARALASCRGAFVAVAGFSGVINVLTLAGSLYMLQVYDRVLSSRSVPTLIGLSVLLLVAYVLQGVLDTIRVRMLARIGARFDEQVSPSAFSASQRLPLMGANGDQALQPLRDLDQIRGFLASLGPTALFDMPWMPLFFVGCFILHPMLGTLALVGGIVIILITLKSEYGSKRANHAQMVSGAARMSIAEAGRRNAETLTAMGMAPAFQKRWRDANVLHIRDWLTGADATSGIGSFAKIFRMVLQSAVLGLGAYLVTKGELSGGAMIAASIMTARALAPIEVAVAHWKGFVSARTGLKRLRQTLDHPSMAEVALTSLPVPIRDVTVENLVVAPPGRQTPTLHGVSFRLEAGHALGIIGPSASGKSTLAKALVGAWKPMKGDVRLDGAALKHWSPDDLGQHIGYLPQEIELFDGTVSENICRFRPGSSDISIVSAAMAAGAHDLILKLENGYDTRIGEGGQSLSGGQRQRIGLARALFGSPFMVVLDEPNSNLDSDGDKALSEAVMNIRNSGCIAVVVTHRPAALASVTHVATMAEGRIQAFGPRDQILQQVIRAANPPAVQRQGAAS